MEYKSFAVKNSIPSAFLSLPLPMSTKKRKKKKFKKHPVEIVSKSNDDSQMDLNTPACNDLSQDSINVSMLTKKGNQVLANNQRKRRRKSESDSLKRDIWTFISDNVSQMKFNLSCNTCYANPKKASSSEQNYALNSIQLSRICRSFNEEIKALAFKDCISNSEMSIIVSTIIFDLEQTLSGKVPYHSFEVFGSYGNGLCCRESDLDLYCMLSSMDDSNMTTMMCKVHKLLGICPKFKDVVLIRHARIPLIKLVHVKTYKECDISFKNVMGVSNTILMKSLMNIYPNIKILTLFLKHLFQKHNLHGSHKITTYILFWLVVYFLQAKFDFDSIEKLRSSGITVFHDNGWNISPLVIDAHHKKSDFEEQLYVLFYEFLEFYANYDFIKFVICPYLGMEIDIREFHNLNIPRCYQTYIKKVENLEIPSFSCSAINIQDPTEHNYNLGKPVEISCINQLKQFCYHLHKILPAPCSEPLNNYTLLQILRINLPTQDHSSKALNQYASIFLHSNMLSLDQSNPLMCKFSDLINGIRKIMEIVFEFELCSPVIEENLKKNVLINNVCERVEVPVAYLSYSTTTKTWRNENVSKIFSKIESHDDWNFEVFIFCEGKPNGKGFNVLFQGENQFNNFLKIYLIKLLQCILKGMDK